MDRKHPPLLMCTETAILSEDRSVSLAMQGQVNNDRVAMNAMIEATIYRRSPVKVQ